MNLRPRPYKACSCRDTETGRLLGKQCPNLDHPSHGRWYARYEAQQAPDGKRRQPRIGPFDTEKECVEALARTLQDGPTVDEILDDYLKSLTCSQRTQDNYRRCLRHIRGLIGQDRAQYVTSDDISYVVDYMAKRGKATGGGLSKRTIEMAICQLRAAYELAVFNKRITRRTIPIGPDPQVITL